MVIEENIPLSKFTTFKIGGPARYFCRVIEPYDFKEAVKFAKEKNIPFLLLGKGSNMLISDQGFSGLVIKNELLGVEFEDLGKKVNLIADSGEDWDYVVNLSTEKGLYGLENLSGIPGSVGAAPVQNIGAYGEEVKDKISWIEVLNTENGETERLLPEDCRFDYRNSIFKSKEGKKYIVTRVAFGLDKDGHVNISYKDLDNFFSNKKEKISLKEVREAVLQIRNKKFPNLEKVGTAGSFFKNPILEKDLADKVLEKYPDIPNFTLENNKKKFSLAWIIDHICNLKDTNVGDAVISSAQALVIINKKKASSDDVQDLALIIKNKVKEKTGIIIEPEVQYIEHEEGK